MTHIAVQEGLDAKVVDWMEKGYRRAVRRVGESTPTIAMRPHIICHMLVSLDDGMSPSRTTAVRLKLKSVEQRKGDALWWRHEVTRIE
jgi:hypothetical protein